MERDFYGEGDAAEVPWEAVLGHKECDTAEAFKPGLFDRHTIGGWRYYYE